MAIFHKDPTTGWAWDPKGERFMKPDPISEQWYEAKPSFWEGENPAFKYDPKRHPLFEVAKRKRDKELKQKFRKQAIDQASEFYKYGYMDRVKSVFDEFNQRFDLAPKTNGHLYIEGNRMMEWDQKEQEREELQNLFPGRMISLDDPDRYAFEDFNPYWGMEEQTQEWKKMLRMGAITPQQAFLRPQYDQKEKEYMNDLLERYSSPEQRTQEEMEEQNLLELTNSVLAGSGIRNDGPLLNDKDEYQLDNDSLTDDYDLEELYNPNDYYTDYYQTREGDMNSGFYTDRNAFPKDNSNREYNPLGNNKNGYGLNITNNEMDYRSQD